MIRIRFPLFALLACAAPVAAAAADESRPGDTSDAPTTITVTEAEPVEEGEPGDRRSTFVIVQTEQGACYAVAPPGGEGMVAGESYLVVAASDVDDALKQKLAVDRPGCVLVDVVARHVR